MRGVCFLGRQVKIMSEKPHSIKSVNLTRGLRHLLHPCVALRALMKSQPSQPSQPSHLFLLEKIFPDIGLQT